MKLNTVGDCLKGACDLPSQHDMGVFRGTQGFGSWVVDPKPPKASRRRQSQTILDYRMTLGASNYINFTKEVLLRLSIFHQYLLYSFTEYKLCCSNHVRSITSVHRNAIIDPFAN